MSGNPSLRVLAQHTIHQGHADRSVGFYIGVRGFHSHVIFSLGVMGLGSGQLEIFVVVVRPSNKGPQHVIRVVHVIGVRGFHSRVILSLGAMGLGPGQLEIFLFRPLNKKKNLTLSGW